MGRRVVRFVVEVAWAAEGARRRDFGQRISFAVKKEKNEAGGQYHVCWLI